MVFDLLSNPEGPDYPDVALVISDVENLKRNLLLFTQIKDLNIPTVLAINMADVMQKKGISIDLEGLEQKLDTKIALISTRKGEGIDKLKELLLDYQSLSSNSNLDISVLDPDYIHQLKESEPQQNIYRTWVHISQNGSSVDNKLPKKTKSELIKLQQKETIKRYQFINNALKEAYTVDKNKATGFEARLDRILTHKVFGYVIFVGILLLIFQAIFDWSTYPSDFIDEQFAALSDWVKTTLPAGILTDLLAEGIIAGIGGIVVFIPPIAFLFFFIALLEESGYMSRVVFLMDKIMRPFGLSGKSVVPLISGTACAIPAVS